jgi:hypothetical protein
MRRARSNTRLPFVTKADTSWILTPLRHAEKQIISFLPSTNPDPCLGDAGVSHFSRSKMITYLSFLRSGGMQRWCEFNALVSAREGTRQMKHCRKMKERQQARLQSMGRKRHMVRRHGNVSRRRDRTVEGKGRTQHLLG